MKAPFVWFGGKRRIAPQVWTALGDPDNYVEPFAGSLAVLLGRPPSRREKLTETVNDADGMLANFWRAPTSGRRRDPLDLCPLRAPHRRRGPRRWWPVTCSRCPRPATFSRRVSVTGRSEGLCEPCARKVIAHVDAAVARLERARPQRSTLDVEVPA